jgi:hypothetical protein
VIHSIATLPGPRRLALLLLMLALATSMMITRTASAECDQQAAKKAYDLGRELADRGQWSDALAQFTRSNLLCPHAKATVAVAICERSLGRFTRAIASFQRALAAPEGQLGPELVHETIAYIEELKPRLARATTTVTPAGATITVDGRPLDVAAERAGFVELIAGTRDHGPGEPAPATPFQMLLDPGPHVIVLVARGTSKVFDTTMTSGDARLDLAVPILDRPGPPPQRGTLASRRRAAVAAFTVGGLGFVTSAIFGGLALEKRGELRRVCLSTCPGATQPKIDAMTLYANFSTIGAVVAGAGAATGAALWVTGGATSAASVRVRPGLARLALTGVF